MGNKILTLAVSLAVSFISVLLLDQEDPLEEANPSSILAWKIPWKEEPARLQSTGLPRVEQNWATEHTLVTNPGRPRLESSVFTASEGLAFGRGGFCFAFTWLVNIMSDMCTSGFCHSTSLPPPILLQHQSAKLCEETMECIVVYSWEHWTMLFDGFLKLHHLWFSIDHFF